MNIVDALVVTLNLDPKPFTKGAKEAETAFTKTKDSATKAGKSIEASGKGAAESISKLRDQVIELFAIFLGGKGLKEFISDLTVANTQIGRLGETIGVQGHTIDAMGKAVEAAGGSYDSTVKSVQALNQSFAELAITGTSAIVTYLRPLQAATGVDLTSKGRTQVQYWESLADALKKIKDQQGAGVATKWASLLGINDPGFVALLEKGSKAYDAFYKTAEKYAVNNNDIAQAEERTKAFSFLDDAMVKLGRDLVTTVSPGMVAITNAIRAFIDSHPEIAKAAFEGLAAAVTLLGVGLSATFGAKLIGQAVGGLKLLTLSAGGLLGKLTLIVAAFEAINAALNLLDPSDKMGSWIDKNIPGAAAVDNWIANKTGGAVGRTYEQNGLGKDGSGASPSGNMTGIRSGRGGSGGKSSGGDKTAGAANGPSIKGRVTPEQAAQILRSVGASPAEAAKLGALVNPESSGNSNIVNNNPGTGDLSYGLWQVNMKGKLGPERMKKYGLKSYDDLKNPYVNAKIALDLYRNGGGGRNWPNTFGGAMWKRDFAASTRGANAAPSAEQAPKEATKSGPSIVSPAAAATRDPLAPKLLSLPVPKNLFGAPGAAVMHHSVTHNNQQSSNNINATSHIAVNVPAGTSPHGIVQALQGAIARNSLAMHANYGIT